MAKHDLDPNYLDPNYEPVVNHTDNNPFHQVQRGLGKGQRFFVAFGSNEAPKFSEGTRRLTSELEKRGIEVTSIEVRGGTHSFRPISGAQLRCFS